MIKGTSAQRVLADKAYASKANRDQLRGRHRDGVRLFSRTGGVHRLTAQSGPGPSAVRLGKAALRLISTRRLRGEQCFGTMTRLFGLSRARYFGRAKTHAQLAMAAIGQNLLKAANKITLTPQTPAIA